ncbi:MAG: hypothetical protein IJX39_10480 [Clostridia bacterium]|nr:hypothetical protein [Clostridia bacterium]
MCIRKRFFIVLLVILALVCIFSLVFGIFAYVTEGKRYVADNIPQNSRLYIDNIYYENGSVYYTIVNDTRHTIGYEEKPHIERKENGVWRLCNDTSVEYYYDGNRLHKFKQTRCRIELDELLDQVVEGEYRLIATDVNVSKRISESGESELYCSFEERRTYIVGYFTLTEDMLS